MTRLSSRGTGERPEDRQAQLLEIAARLFAKHGFDATSLRDIAEEANITKAALYYHFPNKEALYVRIAVFGLERLLDAVMEATSGHRSAKDKVRAFMFATTDYYSRHRDAWITAANAFRGAEESASRAQILMLRDMYEKQLRNCILEGIKLGEFRDVDAAVAGRLLLASVNSLSRWHKTEGKLTAHEVVEQFVDIILTGLCAK